MSEAVDLPVKGVSVPYSDIVKKCNELYADGHEIISVCPALKVGSYLIVYRNCQWDGSNLWNEEEGSEGFPPVEPEAEPEPDPFDPEPSPEPEPVGVSEERRQELREDNDKRLKERGNLSGEKMRQAGVKDAIDRLNDAAMTFFKGDKHLCRAWVLAEVPALDPTKNVLTQLESDDIVTLTACLEDPKRMSDRLRELRYNFRQSANNIKAMKPGTRINRLTGGETESQLKKALESLRKYERSLAKEVMTDEEFRNFFDAEPLGADDEKG